MPPLQRKPELDDHPTFKDATVLRILETGFKKTADAPGKQLTFSKPALSMANEYIRLFTLEAVHRSAETAKANAALKLQQEGRGPQEPGPDLLMDVRDLQQNTASLTLDFGV